MHRDMGRPSFTEAMVAESLGQNPRLERIDDAVDWERLAQVVAGVHAASRGRPSYPPLLMVKVLLLQQWYTLSDPQMEEALSDRLSFRRFVGLGLEDDTPDHSTISRFRVALEAAGLSERLFEVLTAQLEAQGLMLKQGTLLDATLVAAQVRRPPLAAGRGAASETDPDAAWTQTGRGTRSHFGYKMHLGVDADTGVVRRAVLTPANVYESEVADTLVSGDEQAVYADRAYESKRRRQWLRAQGINDRIMHRANKHQPELTVWQHRRNALIEQRRALVEKVFGTLKRSYRYHRVAYDGLGRNGVEMWFKLMAYNLRKADTLSWAAH